MEDTEIFERVNKAIALLKDRDHWLLTKDLSEQSISHKLAEYLQREFANFNVDCEYNGNQDAPGGKKKIFLLKEDLKGIGQLREAEESDLEKELTERSVFPDIIIHQRGTNESNLCIIEVKKSTSKVSFDYDYLKLRAYTRHDYGEDLKYQLGLFICIETGVDTPAIKIEQYSNGTRV